MTYIRRVEDTVGAIIQFKYGEDGVDPTKSDHGKTLDLDSVIMDEENEVKQ